MESYLDGTMRDSLQRRAEKGLEDIRSLDPEEAAVLALLQQRLQRLDAPRVARRSPVHRLKAREAQRGRATAA